MKTFIVVLMALMFTACGDATQLDCLDGCSNQYSSIQGPVGTDGTDGQDGKDGRDGMNGQNGNNGKDGKDGAAGQNAPERWYVRRNATSLECAYGGTAADTFLDVNGNHKYDLGTDKNLVTLVSCNGKPGKDGNCKKH